MYYRAICEEVRSGENGKPRTPRAYEYAWEDAIHDTHDYYDYTFAEVYRKARLWAFERVNRTVAWLEIYNSRGKCVYAKFARITKDEKNQLLAA